MAREIVPTPSVARPAWWRRPWLAELAVLAGMIAVGVLVTWPRAMYLAGTLPANRDQAQYVWNMWWIAHQLIHLGNPWFTSYLAAPVGTQLGFDTLMPLVGVAMAPVTLVFGPSASYNLLVIVTPGLASYAMYRLASLWLPGRLGPVAAGAFYGLSGMVTFQDWHHLNLALGCVFLPLAMEAAIGLRRGPTIGRGVILGVVVGTAMLVDQEFAVLAAILVALLLTGWLLIRPGVVKLRCAAVSAVTALAIASPQLIAMAQQAAGGGIAPQPSNYINYAAQLPALFWPSQQLAYYGAGGLGSIFQARAPGDGSATFGVVLSVLAVLGLAVSWQRRSARLLGLLWLGSAILALGPALYVAGHQFVPLAVRWHGLAVSPLMPVTWLMRVPLLSSFREPGRLAFLGLVAAALLAGAAVDWLRRHARPAVAVVVVVGLLEAASGSPHQPVMPTTLPAVDRVITADHSGSVVVDVPFGIEGTPRLYGNLIPAPALVLATADGHPRAVSYTSWAVRQTLTGIGRHAFYAGLVRVWEGHRLTPAQIATVRQDLRTLHVGWVLVWLERWAQTSVAGRFKPQSWFHYSAIFRYLGRTGFHFSFQADGVAVYRRWPG